MGDVKQSKRPPKVITRKDNPNKVKVFAKGGWMKDAVKKPGALRASLGVKGDAKIPAQKLAKAAKAPGTLGKRARLAQTFAKFRKK
jgi:hypothetical protein